MSQHELKNECLPKIRETPIAEDKTNDEKISWKLQEILHQPVTFTTECLQKDTKNLNKAISKGYTINEIVKTETGIVYVLMKWKKLRPVTVKSKKQLEKQNNSWKSFVGGKYE